MIQFEFTRSPKENSSQILLLRVRTPKFKKKKITYGHSFKLHIKPSTVLPIVNPSWNPIQLWLCTLPGMQIDKSYEQVLEKLHWPFPWLTGNPTASICAVPVQLLPWSLHTHTDHALSRRDSLKIKCSSCSLHFLVWGTFTLQTSMLKGFIFLLLGHRHHSTVVW